MIEGLSITVTLLLTCSTPVKSQPPIQCMLMGTRRNFTRRANQGKHKKAPTLREKSSRKNPAWRKKAHNYEEKIVTKPPYR